MKKKILYYLCSFLLAIVIFLIIATLSNIIPFGKYIFNNIDSYVMYPGLLKASVHTNNMYTLYGALGVDFYNIKTLYMNSPLNYLLLLFNYKDIFDFYALLLFLRCGLSCLTMTIYLNSISKEKYKFKQILFGLIYSLSNYLIIYGVNIMWMDSFILLPLIILGLDKLIEENKCLLYIITLSLSIYINFYIAFTLCIFVVLYFIYKVYINKCFSYKLLGKFLLCSLLCGLVNSIVLVPQLFSLVRGRGNNFSFSALNGFNYYSIFTFFYSLTIGSTLYNDNLFEGTLFIYVSLIISILIFIYIMNKKINKREKIATLAMLLFFYLSFGIKIIDYAWNMFQRPIGFSHRYSFVFTFFMIVIAFKSFINLDKCKLNKKHNLIIVLTFFVLSLFSFVYKILHFEFVLSNISVLLYFLSIIIFVIYYYLLNKKSKLIYFIVILELIINGVVYFRDTNYITKNDVDYYLNRKEVIDKFSEDNFFRYYLIESNENDGFLYDAPIGGLFSSSFDNYSRLYLCNYLDYGIETINHISLKYPNPAVVSLFNFRYLMFGTSDYYQKIDDTVYENPNYLNLGFVIPSFKQEELINKDRFNNLNKVYSSLLNENTNLFYDIDKYNWEDISNDDKYLVSYEFESDREAIIIPYNYDVYKFNELEINGNVIKQSDDLITLLHKGDKVKINYNIDKDAGFYKLELVDEDFYVLLMDNMIYLDSISKIKSFDNMYDIKTDNHVLEGKVNTTGGTLFISISYNDQFKIYVDGKETDYYDVYSFIGIDLDEGEHEIVIDYTSKGYKEGKFISIVSLIGIIILLIIEKRKLKMFII